MKKILLGTIFLIFFLLPQAFGASEEIQINKTIQSDDMILHISKLIITENPGQKSVEVELIFKNTDVKPAAANSLFMSLKDSDGRKANANMFSSTIKAVDIPSGDITKGIAFFEITPNTDPIKFEYSAFFDSSKIIDLTTSGNDSPPTSEWKLQSNKGFSISDSSTELIINNEKRVDDTLILDVTIKNIGNESFPYNLLYAAIKDQTGKMFSSKLFTSSKTALHSGDLVPGDFVRGDIEFKVDPTSKNFMFIYSENFGFGSYLNSGLLDTKPTQVQTPPVHEPVIEQNGETIPKWVKNTMEWYVDGQISEQDLISALQFLIKEGILKID